MVRPEGENPIINQPSGSRIPIFERVVSSARRLWHNVFVGDRPYFPRSRNDVLVDSLGYFSRRLRLPRMAGSVDDLMGMLPEPKEEIKPLLSEQDVMDILQGKDISEERK